MPNTYPVGVFPGDRDEKKRVRAWFYTTAISLVGREKFLAQHHVVLGGAGGDIAVLLALGVPPDNILVAELSSSAVRKLRTLYPDVRVLREDVLLTVSRAWDRDIGTVNLDFCGKIRRELMDRVGGVVKQLPRGVLIAVTLCGSREQEAEVRGRLNDLREAYPDLASEGMYRSMALMLELKERVPVRAHEGIAYVSRGMSTRNNRVNSLMSTTIFQTLPPRKRNELFLMMAEQIHVRELARALWVSGYGASVLSELFGLPRQQLAGWFAHETRMTKKEG